MNCINSLWIDGMRPCHSNADGLSDTFFCPTWVLGWQLNSFPINDMVAECHILFQSILVMFCLLLRFFGPGVFIPTCCFASFMWSFSLTPYHLLVSPIYTIGQSLQGMEYTTPDESWADYLSLGCTKSCLKDFCSFRYVATPFLLKVLCNASETPLKNGIVAIALVCNWSTFYSFFHFFLLLKQFVVQQVCMSLTSLKAHGG